MLKLLKNYKNYKVLIENADTLEFKQINNINKEIEKYAIYEIDHVNKVIYLELIDSKKYILIASNDELELPYTVVKNLNEAAEFMKAEATHVYRAWRNAKRPKVFTYNDYKLIFL